MDKVEEEYREIFTSPIGVPLQCQVNHSIALASGASIPNGVIYHCYIMGNDAIKRQIQDLLGSSGQVHQLVGSRYYWYRRRIELGGSVLTIGHWIRLLSRIGIQSTIFMTFWTSSRGPNISARLTWSPVITRYQSNPTMCGILPLNPRGTFQMVGHAFWVIVSLGIRVLPWQIFSNYWLIMVNRHMRMKIIIRKF